MKRAVRVGLGLIVVAALAGPARAQTEKSAPKVVTMTTTATEILGRIRAAMLLTTPAEQKWWPELEKYLDVFLIGLSREKPGRMDVYYSGDLTRYRLALPVADAKELQNFRNNNLFTLGIDTRRRSATLYQLSAAYEGYMRYYPNFGYVAIAELLPLVPANFDPLADIQPLLKRNYDIAIEGTNQPQGVEQRHQSIRQEREDWLAKLTRAEDETADDFALRKLLWQHQFDETGRIYAEAAYLLLGGFVEPDAREARIEIDLEPIRDTDLDKNIQQIGKAASRFGAIERMPTPILSARVDLPLDAMRQENILELTALLRDRYHGRVDAARDMNAQQKESAHKAVDRFLAIFDDGAKTGRLDAFGEGTTAGDGKYMLIGGAVPADGTAMIEVLELLGQTGRGNKVEMNIAEQGDVKFHRATFPQDFRADMQAFFGDESFYVATGKDTLMFGAGEGSLEALKAAVDRSGENVEPKPDSPFVDAVLRIAPWAWLLDRRMGDSGRPKFRKMAIEAGAPRDDQLSLVLQRDKDRVTGLMSGNRGVLRLVGKVLAEFTRNIDEQ